MVWFSNKQELWKWKFHPPAATKASWRLFARAWMRSLGRLLERGALFVIDYGFPAREYFHPQRSMGTLACHYRHRVHGDPFYLPGLQDITAHVDFSALARAATDGGLEVLGYASQAQFLVNCGITDLLAAENPDEREALPARRRRGAEAALAVRDGRAVQGARRGQGCGRHRCMGFREGDRSGAL